MTFPSPARVPSRRGASLLGATVALAVSFAAAASLPVTSGASPSPSAATSAPASSDTAVLRTWSTLAQGVAVGLRPTAHGQSRGIAMVQGAVYDAVNAIDGGHEGYLLDAQTLDADPQASYGAAIATAAHDILVGLAPASQTTLDTALADTLAAIPDGDAEDAGVAVGRTAAAEMLADRLGDGFLDPFDFSSHVGTGPGQWNPTALDPDPWVANLEPFLMSDPAQFRSAGPYRLNSRAYAQDFQEVKELGSVTSSRRTADQTTAALFWQSPPILFWNPLARDVAIAKQLTVVDEARMLALVNMAAADGVISCWNEKYDWDFWRPVTAIRAAGTDGNRATKADPTWTPLFDGMTQTFPPLVNPANPPFPEHPSGHGCVSGAALHTLRLFIGTDKMDFSVSSVRFPGQPRSFHRFTGALDEIIDARVWAGIHFRNADVQGAVTGRKIARLAVRHYFQPVG